MKPKDKPRAVLFPTEGESLTVVKVDQVYDKIHGTRVFVTLENPETKYRTLLEVVPH